jgi:hypothetical protein
MRATLVSLLVLLPAAADTLVLENGLRLEGVVERTADGYAVTRDGRRWTFPAGAVAEVQSGESAIEVFARRAAALEAGDAAGWYRLGLFAREAGLPNKARQAFERVLAADPEHRAARRELGYERVDGRWLARHEAMRQKGFVFAGGQWVLPEEADRRMREGAAPETGPGSAKRADEVVNALLDPDPQVRAAAAELLTEIPGPALVRPLRRALFSRHVETRLLAVSVLGDVADRVSLPWLIRTSMYDASEEVRNRALRAIRNFRDEDVFYPYARALFSASPGARIQAARALAQLDDLRGVDVILRRVSIGIGASPRANIFVGRQQSYIQDFDVEIAQAAAIGDPIVQSIRDGVILDYKVLGGSGEAWVIERRAYAEALARLTGRDFGGDFEAYARYAEEMRLPKVALGG